MTAARAGGPGPARPCGDCAGDLDHCHEVLVVHADGSLDCLSDCRAGEAVHAIRIGCAELEPACACAGPVAGLA